ncbi:ankyrin repeat domain-containing protein 23 isoform X3 [Python bivittatus]|uniref:Ankyrin repeat domain-containing protein 23 isoform X3 n=1 Tax=Python bivittatus TaxID=176946 RepID=A0A9F5IFM2_PYTBI|nr:ankyrin repeat domain-containing protein 23 isoform X3 [Python bivittatus]
MQSLGPSGCRRRALDGSLNPPSPGSNKCRCPARLPGRERSGSGSGGTMEILSIQQLVSDEQPEGKVGCFAARARGAAWEPERWRSGPAGAWWESVEREKQKAEDEKKKKLEALNNSRLKLDSLQDLEAFVKLHKQKKKRKKVALPKQQEPEIIIESVESEQFLDAALENQIPVIDKYLADGGDPNAHDKFKCTALHRACLRGHAEIVDKLLEAGAKLEPRDMLEATPLFWACRGGHLDILKGLISRGAKISTRDKLWSTPLHVAVRTGHSDCAEHLIACGANINAQDKEGDTPIHDAVRLGRFKAVKTLLMYGANLGIQNEVRKNPGWWWWWRSTQLLM